jgi:hypothetical protein
MIEDWCKKEVQSLSWDIEPRQKDFIHYMKYEFKNPNLFCKDHGSIICIWKYDLYSICICANVNNVIIIKKSKKIEVPYREIFTQKIKEFIPEIHRFV